MRSSRFKMGPGMAAANRGRLNGKALWLVLRQSCGFGFQQQETFEMFWGMCRVPVHDLAGPLS
jgi:hypothetical protein